MGICASLGERLISFDKEQAGAVYPDGVWEKNRKAVYLVCEPGYPNYGDELIAREWLRYIDELDPDLPVIVDCSRPGPATSILHGIHKNLICTDTISRLVFEPHLISVAYDAVMPIAEAVSDALNWKDGNPRYASGIRLIEDHVCAIHYLGGGYMNGMWKQNLARLELGRWAAAARGIPVIATGLGLMPLDDEDKEYVRSSTSGFEFVGLRDESSFEVMGGVGNAYLMPDDCFINALDGCIRKPNLKTGETFPEFIVCVQSEFGSDSKRMFDTVTGALDTWDASKDNGSVGVIECNPVCDRQIYDYLVEKGYHPRFFSTLELLEKGLPIAENQKWISSRYHPHLIASSFGCSGCFLLTDERYYSVKQEAVHRMGSNWKLIALGNIPDTPGSGFADTLARERYSVEIRSAVDPFYDKIIRHSS